MDWLEDAPCKGLHQDIFFPPVEETNQNVYYRVGKLVCNSCPVWEDCFEYGREENWGLWGGLTPQERRGTAKIAHGSLEMYRSGCRCPKCRESSVTVRKKVTHGVLPAQGQHFDIESLVFKLSSM
jgi:hypothetical protein